MPNKNRLSAQHTGRVFFSDAEKDIHKRLEVALQCCEEECCHHTHHHHGHHDHGQPDIPQVDHEDDDLDSDEELLLMGIGENGEFLEDVDDNEDKSNCDGGVGQSAVQLRREELLRQHQASQFTVNCSETAAVKLLESGTDLTFPVVCLVHRLQSFNEKEPTPLENGLDRVIKACLCDLLRDTRSQKFTHTPFTYLRVGLRACEKSAPLPAFCASQYLANLNALPAVICVRQPQQPATIVAGLPAVRNSFGNDTESVGLESCSKMAQWLATVAKLSIHALRNTTRRAHATEDIEDEDAQDTWCDRAGAFHDLEHAQIAFLNAYIVNMVV